MATSALTNYESQTTKTPYDPGEVRIWYDNRTYAGFADKLPKYQQLYLSGLTRLGWPSLTGVKDLEPGKLRLIWYTHVGNPGSRDFPLHKALAVKEMFDSLSDEGFRPMILGWSGENPFPMLGGIVPEAPKKKKEPKVAKTWSNAVAGHSSAVGETPHDRVMAIIREDEEREAKLRELQVKEWGEGKGGGEKDALV